ncbi:hypothetical protein [Niallia sp. 01092]|uniref:hypothetical protein n=1 Tax=unclassified Niallia TaxID=2837522 RepID=UPI003FD10BFF
MNTINTLFSLMGGRRSRRFFNMLLNRRNNNWSMIAWSLLGLTTLGVIGSRNTRWMHKIQEVYNNLRNNTKRPIQSQMNFASEFAKELTPQVINNKNDQK